jgi:hypothetical protein
MSLLSIFRRKDKKASHDASCDTSTSKDDTSDPSSYAFDVTREVEHTQPKLEDPLISISRQLTQLQFQVGELKPSIESGVESLREDHYRIIEEQANSVKDYKEHLSNRLQNLKQATHSAEDEIEKLEIDQKIVEALEGGEKRAVELANQLEASRQYVSDRLKVLLELKQVEKIKRSRKVYYTLKSH